MIADRIGFLSVAFFTLNKRFEAFSVLSGIGSITYAWIILQSSSQTSVTKVASVNNYKHSKFFMPWKSLKRASPLHGSGFSLLRNKHPDINILIFHLVISYAWLI